MLNSEQAQNSKFKVGLVAMPWSIFNRPSVQVGVLKAYLERQDSSFQVNGFHPYLGLAKELGTGFYNAIAQDVWLCDAIYAGLLFPEQKNKIRKFANKSLAGIAEAKDKDVDQLWDIVGEQTQALVNGRYWQEFKLVGFTVCFSQLLSSLYAASLLKEKYPELPIVFGGSSCVGAMGRSLLQAFPFIDYVVHGEGELPMVNLCRYLRGEVDSLAPQVFSPGQQLSGVDDGLAGCQIQALTELPAPDYDDYFKEQAAQFKAAPFIPELPVEFSRGCWWAKCTFCNLNLQWQGYRGRSGEEMARLVVGLAERYGCLDFSFTDNALPVKESDIFFEKIASLNRDYRFFAEIRVSQRGKSLQTLRRGGLVAVQAGIESLSQALLKRMNKGARVIENLALMKEAVALGIVLDGNLITGFPQSTSEDVEETLANLDFVLPFTPLSTASFFLGHGSPVAANPEDYGIRAISQHANNRKFFPKDVLASLELMIKDYQGDRVAQRKLWKPVERKVKAWQRFHAKRRSSAHQVCPLSYRDGGSVLIIRQELPDQAALHHRLRGISREIYLACGDICDIEDLLACFQTLKRLQLEKFLNDLVLKRLLFAQGTKYLALAVRK
jgi:ribosomal peptide maturation radical SAM protein 1